MKDYDIIIIGAGAAGLIGARFAAQIGARVALVERARIGGDCTWTGCVPSKALIRAARSAHEARTGSRFGVKSSEVSIDWGELQTFVHAKIDEIYAHTTPEQLTKEGIDVFIGECSFASPTKLSVAGHGTLTTKKFLICVGAEPTVPGIPGLESAPYLTYLNLFELKEQPQSLIIIGAGPLGVEMAQAFQRLGTQVTLIDSGLFSREEPEVAVLMERRLREEGVNFASGKVSLVVGIPTGVRVEIDGRFFEGERLLVSTGRHPRLEGLELEKAGVAFTAKGIEVDDSLRTSSPSIYACGDCIGSYQFSHYAGWQAFQVVRSALLPGKGSGETDLVPWCTFTDPEVARVGPLELEAQTIHGSKLQVKTIPMTGVDRAVCEDDEGFIKLLHVGTRIVGATVVAERAGELINEIALAIKNNVGLDKLAGTIHAYPTYSTGLQLMASQIATETFFDGTLGRIALKLSGLVKRGDQ
ncbi:MAG: FAD-dependent oxidoreductase [Armatimonadota bacterium]|nr:FAD-dependent oxidoreductase [Armatimonadota bacterium]